MSAFTHFSAFSRIGRTEKYRLDAPLLWRVGSKQSAWVLEVAPGTIFDITVPWYARPFLSPHDRQVLPAAAVHDELLRRQHDPAFASAEFRRAAKARGCSTLWSWTLFLSTLIWTASRRQDHEQRFTT